MISDFYYLIDERDCKEIEKIITTLTNRVAKVEYMPSLSDTDEYDNSIQIVLPVGDFGTIVNEEDHAIKTMDLLFRYLLSNNAIQLNDTIFLSNRIRVFFDRGLIHRMGNVNHLVANVTFEGYIENVTNNPQYNQYLNGVTM